MAFHYPPSSGGGSSISDPSVAFLRSDGNNGTAAIGDPSKPYTTLQAAFTAGARSFDVGIGSFGGIASAGTCVLRFRGRGPTVSLLAGIASVGGAVEIYDTAGQSVFIDNITVSGAPSSGPETPGQTGGLLILHDVKSGPCSADGGSALTDGDESGAGGEIRLFGACNVNFAYAQGGNLMFGATTGNANGATGGIVSVTGPSFVSECRTAQGNNGEGNPGGAFAGTINLQQANVDSVTGYNAINVIASTVVGVFRASSYP